MKEFCCDTAKEAMDHLPDEITTTDLSDFFKIFGDYSRIRLLFAIKETELCVHDLSIILGMQQPAVSHQLKILRHYKLVTSRREGKKTFYSLNDQHIFDILAIGMEHVRHTHGAKKGK